MHMYSATRITQRDTKMSEYKREAISPLLRYYILNRDGFDCRYCEDGDYCERELHIDHINPISNGGTNHRCNLATACKNCNLSKGGKVDELLIQREHEHNILYELGGWGWRYRRNNVPVEYIDDIKHIMYNEEQHWMKAVEVACMLTSNFIDRIEIARGLSRYLGYGGKL